MTDATSGPKPSEPPSQPGPPDAMSQYFQAVRQALGAIEMTQVPVIRQAAERFAATILTGRLVHVFGLGITQISLLTEALTVIHLAVIFHNTVHLFELSNEPSENTITV